MSHSVNFKWPQGEDLRIQLIYKEGDDSRRATPVPLSTGYQLRMDIVMNKNVIYSFESKDHPNSLGTGQNKQPNINIYLPRALTLPGGVMYEEMSGASPTSSFGFDIFLRNTVTDKQVKILKGSVSIEASNTLWI